MREIAPNSQALAIMSTGATTFAISQAMADLNRSGRVVDERGALTIRGERVVLQVRRGEIVGVAEGNIEIPWPRLRRLL